MTDAAGRRADLRCDDRSVRLRTRDFDWLPKPSVCVLEMCMASRDEVIAVCKRVAEEQAIPPVLLIACAVAESDLGVNPRYPRYSANDSLEWPNVSVGIFHQTIRWAPEYRGGEDYPGAAEVERVEAFYTDTEHAATVAARQLRQYYSHARSGGDVLKTLFLYNWPAGHGEPYSEAHRANYTRGLREAEQIVGRNAPEPEFLQYDPDTPLLLQTNDWACSVFSATMALNSIGVRCTWDQVREWMGGRVTPEWGLMDASGAGMVAMFQERGLTAGYRGRSWENPVTLDEVKQRAGQQPVCIGGTALNHWMFVRRVADDGGLVLGNPAPGWRGIGQELDPNEFDIWGPWSIVWIDLEGTTVTDGLQKQIQDLTNALAYLCDNLVEDRLCRENLSPEERADTVAEVQRVLRQFIEPSGGTDDTSRARSRSRRFDSGGGARGQGDRPANARAE
jgi:hypothetical protein